jgi:hypothetical protein
MYGTYKGIGPIQGQRLAKAPNSPPNRLVGYDTAVPYGLDQMIMRQQFTGVIEQVFEHPADAWLEIDYTRTVTEFEGVGVPDPITEWNRVCHDKAAQPGKYEIACLQLG